METAQTRDVPAVFGHQLAGSEQHEDSMMVQFATGKTDTASFVVGCDGFPRDAQKTLFNEAVATFMRLIRVSLRIAREGGDCLPVRVDRGGISPYPELFEARGSDPMFNVYRDGSI